MNPGGQKERRFSRVKPVVVALLVIAVFTALWVVATGPRQQREQATQEARREAQVAPAVLVTKAALLPPRGDLQLPGTIQAIQDTAIYARAEGYLRKRFVDIGDAVKEGQVLAQVETPELDRQIQQAQALLSRSEAALAQAKAALEQSTTQLKLSEVTAQRWNTLFSRRVVSRQEADEKQAAYDARRADNQAAQANLAAADNAVRASQAELQRLMELKAFQEIRAPFSGIITSRNIDPGALIRIGASEGRELFHLAQIETVRIMINVPQTNVPAIRIGGTARITVQERPGTQFSGKIVRTASALDIATRTLLTELHVSNPDRMLLPGMYAQVRLGEARSGPVVIVSGDTLMIRSDGPQVALVGEGGKIHFQKVTLGRDYGMQTEIMTGLAGGETLVINPSDEIQEGVVVRPRPAREGAADSQKKK